MEIKCQLDATDDTYCRFYCLLNMFQAPLCPSSGARESLPVVFGALFFKLSVWCGAEGYVSGLHTDNLKTKAPNTTGSDSRAPDDRHNGA